MRMVGEQRPCEVGGEAEQTYLLCRVCILLWSFLLLMIIALDWAMGFIINFTDDDNDNVEAQKTKQLGEPQIVVQREWVRNMQRPPFLATSTTMKTMVWDFF